MRLAIGLALIGVGVVLLIWGVTAADSFASNFKEFFTGNPTDKSMWLIVGGVGAAICGVVLSAFAMATKKGELTG